MKVFLYVAEKNAVGKRLEKKIKTSINGMDLQVYRTIKTLVHKLSQPVGVGNEDIVVLLISSNKELQDLISVRHLINDVRIIIILPDMKKDTIAKGHLLRPRFLAFADKNFEMVTAVLSNMVANNYQVFGYRPRQQFTKTNKRG